MPILSRSEDVQAFLTEETRRDGGPAPCAILADRWIERRLGFSPLQRYGRALDSGSDADAWLGEWGGLAVAARRVLHAAGLAIIGRAEIGDGDVAVLADARTRHLAIRSGGRWVSRNENGFFSAPYDARVIVAWRVG